MTDKDAKTRHTRAGIVRHLGVGRRAMWPGSASTGHPMTPAQSPSKSQAVAASTSWKVIDGQPAVTDLRVVPRDGEAISQTDLRINLARIAAVVASKDTAEAREVWAGVADAFADAAERSGLPRTGFEWLAGYRPDARDLDRAVRQAYRSLEENDPGAKRRPGRPTLPDEHYEAVAALAKALKKTKTRSLYRDFKARWAEATGGDPPAVTTVRDWIAEAKRRKLLAQDEILRSRHSRPAPRTTEGHDR